MTFQRNRRRAFETLSSLLGRPDRSYLAPAFAETVFAFGSSTPGALVRVVLSGPGETAVTIIVTANNKFGDEDNPVSLPMPTPLIKTHIHEPKVAAADLHAAKGTLASSIGARWYQSKQQ